MSATPYPLAFIAFLATDCLFCAQARSAPARAEATAVVRESIAARAPRQYQGAIKPAPTEPARTVRTVIRPCDPAEPARLCTLTLIEVQ